MAILDSVIAATVPKLPRGLVYRVAKRYISGETLQSALDTTRNLNGLGISTTLDVLGEHIQRLDQADRTVAIYRETVAGLEREDLDGNISIKLTAFGLLLDPAHCLENVRSIVDEAARRRMFVRIDMEDSSTTDATLEIYREIRKTRDNVGLVLQAMLHRSQADAEALAKRGARVRVCKGIYREPERIAYQDDADVNASYERLVETLLAGGCHVGIATHDARLVDAAYATLERLGGCAGNYEFQMLYGVTEKLRDSIVARGHPLRVYVPFGEQWYEYSVRRLRENPQIAGHVFRAMLGLGG